MRINTNTDSLELTVNEVRTLEKARKICQQLGKHGDDTIQDFAAKVVANMNHLDIALAKADALPQSEAEAVPY